MAEYTKICKAKNDYKAECTLKVVMHDIKFCTYIVGCQGVDS